MLPSPVVQALYRRHIRRGWAADGLDLEPGSLSTGALLARLDEVLQHPFAFPDVPTLWLLGATDAQAPTPAQVLAHQPHAQVVHVPGGHRPFATHPGPLFTELERWWASVG